MYPASRPLREAWDRLALASDNVFSTLEWADCWWRHYGADHSALAIADDDKDPKLMLPLVRSGRALRRLRIVGSERADQLGPVGEHALWSETAELVQAAKQNGQLKADVLLLQDQPVGSDWWAPLGGHVLRTVASPTLRFVEPDWDGYLGGLSKNLRGQVRTKERRLRREHNIDIRVSTPDCLDVDLKTFYRLHIQRWDASAEFASGTLRKFTEEFCHVAADRGWLRLRILEVDGVPGAAQLNFRYGNAEYLYQSGRDPALDTLSAGFVLTVDTLRSTCEDGLREFRFLRGNEAYKYRFSNIASDVQSVAVPLTARGRVAAELARRRSGQDEPPAADLPASL